MPGGSTESLGNIIFQSMFALGGSSGVTTPSVNQNTSTTTTYPLIGLRPNDIIDLQSQSHVAGLSIGSSWCAANDVVTVQFINSTTGTITAQSNYVILAQVSRLERASLGLSAFPAAIT